MYVKKLVGSGKDLATLVRFSNKLKGYKGQYTRKPTYDLKLKIRRLKKWLDKNYTIYYNYENAKGEIDVN